MEKRHAVLLNKNEIHTHLVQVYCVMSWSGNNGAFPRGLGAGVVVKGSKEKVLGIRRSLKATSLQYGMSSAASSKTALTADIIMWCRSPIVAHRGS